MQTAVTQLSLACLDGRIEENMSGKRRFLRGEADPAIRGLESNPASWSETAHACQSE
jgi:hypothetical protein